MSGSVPVRIDWSRGLAVVTFDSPPLNLLDAALESALIATVAELEQSAPRGVLFRAEGKVVTGGVDVNVFAAQGSGAAARPLLERLLDVSERVDGLPCPTVFAAHGLTLTWAFELALACDIILASTAARFGLVERRVGLTPTMGGPQRLVERAGSARAKEIVMTGEIFPAATLSEWNIVNRVLDESGFDDTARAFAQDLADGPTLAHAATKQLVRLARERGVEAANAGVIDITAPLFDSDDLKGAVQAFLSTGPDSATFNGR